MIARFDGINRFLSNFWHAEVQLDGDWYPTVENAYQAAKSSNLEHRKWCMICLPGQAKRAGSVIKVRADWEVVKVGIMLDLLRQKFRGSQALAERLINTGTEQLIEGNHWGDTFWGVDDKLGGQNQLGELLMQIRHELRASGWDANGRTQQATLLPEE